MKRLLLFLVPGSLCGILGLAAPAPAPAASDFFLHVSGIPGESADAKMSKAADVLAFGWGVKRGGATRNRPAGPRFADFAVTKYVDSMSPALMLKVADGSLISSVKFTVRRSGTTQTVVNEFCLQGVTVMSLSSGGSGGEDRQTEEINLRFQKIQQRYTSVDAKGGLTPYSAGWDLLAPGPLAGGFPSNCGQQ